MFLLRYTKIEWCIRSSRCIQSPVRRRLRQRSVRSQSSSYICIALPKLKPGASDLTCLALPLPIPFSSRQRLGIQRCVCSQDVAIRPSRLVVQPPQAGQCLTTCAHPAHEPASIRVMCISVYQLTHHFTSFTSVCCVRARFSLHGCLLLTSEARSPSLTCNHHRLRVQSIKSHHNSSGAMSSVPRGIRLLPRVP